MIIFSQKCDLESFGWLFLHAPNDLHYLPKGKKTNTWPVEAVEKPTKFEDVFDTLSQLRTL
jgi:hypothetical protein